MKYISLILITILISCSSNNYENALQNKRNLREIRTNTALDLMGHEYLIQTLREYDKRLISLYPQVSGADGHLTYEKGAKEDLEYGRVNYIIFHGSGIFPDMDAFRDLMFQKHKIRIFNSHIATSHSQELSHKIAETYNSQVIAYLNKKHGSNIVEIEFDKWWDELWKKRRDNT